MQNVVIKYSLSKIRRRVEQNPSLAVRADSNRRLRTRRGVEIFIPRSAAIWLVAIPLIISTASGGAENKYVDS